jgi:hypothetical protein
LSAIGNLKPEADVLSVCITNRAGLFFAFDGISDNEEQTPSPEADFFLQTAVLPTPPGEA